MEKNKKKKKSRTKWIMTVMITSFILSLIFSILSESVIPNINIVFGILIIIIFLFFDICISLIFYNRRNIKLIKYTFYKVS